MWDSCDGICHDDDDTDDDGYGNHPDPLIDQPLSSATIGALANSSFLS
jgi:hypothetical protein